MKNYDDLQRFKEKTQTDNIAFQDMSEQILNSGSTRWAIINQLCSNESETVLAREQQRVDIAVSPPNDAVSHKIPTAEISASSAPAPRKENVGLSGGRPLLDSLLSSLKSDGFPGEPVSTPPHQEIRSAAMPPKVTLTKAESVNRHADAVASVGDVREAQKGPLPREVKPSPSPTAPPPRYQATSPQTLPPSSPLQRTPQPSYQPPVSSAVTTVYPQGRYKQLFTAVKDVDGPPPSPAAKEVPLQSLLERIASCR